MLLVKTFIPVRPMHFKTIGRLLFAATGALAFSGAFAGDQRYEPLAASVQAALHRSVADQASPRLAFDSPIDGAAWLNEMSRRLEKRIPDRDEREDFLTTVQYEATRAGLDPQMVLGVIQVESAFRKYAVSRAGARGYMQVMPFWAKLIGEEEHNLFNLRTNLRYGCTILRHYLDIERGDLFRALGRYNGSLGKSHYPNLVLRVWSGSWGYAGGGVTVTPTVYMGDGSTIGDR
jgi:soluble lytic murein transglycosylase-like protein